MVTQPIPMSPGTFESEPYVPDENVPLYRQALPSTVDESATSGVERSFDEEVTHRTSTSDLPVECLLVVDSEDERVSLTLPFLTDTSYAPATFKLETPATVPGLQLKIELSPEDMRGELQIQTNYSGLGVDTVLSYARLSEALRREAGRLTISAYHEGAPLHLASLDLPLPFDEADRERVRRDLIFWEAVYEVSASTGTGLVCPSSVTEDDLGSLNWMLEAIRKGWIAEKVKDFTIPLPPDTLRNLLDSVEAEGDVIKQLALDFPSEVRTLFGVRIDLGHCIRYAPKAHLLTPIDKMREWLATEPLAGDSYKTVWLPMEDTLLHTLFMEWPQPSLSEVRQDLEAFEQDYGMSTSEFRRAWENGDPKAWAVEDGDIWLTLSDVEQTLDRQS